MRILRCGKNLNVPINDSEREKNPIQKRVDGCIMETTEMVNNGGSIRCNEQCPHLIKIEAPKRRLP